MELQEKEAQKIKAYKHTNLFRKNLQFCMKWKPMKPRCLLILDLKLVSAIFYQIFIFSQNDSHLKTMKNVFYFT